MKKLFFTLCALCVSVSTWALQNGATAWTDSNRGEVYQDANNTGLYFYISGTDAVLTWSEASTSNYSSLSALTIPASVTYDGVEYPVTKIGDYAFYDAATIEGEVVIPANILNLGISAFENCTKISAVTIEYSETAITETNNQLYGCSFYGCSGIKTITVNRDITVQRDSDTNQAYRVSPFTSLTGVGTVNFGVEVTKVPRNMCYGCANITAVNCYARTIPSLGTESFNDINKESCTLHVCKSLLESYKETYWATQFTLIENDLPDPGLEEGTYCDLTTGLYFEINEDETTASIYHDETGVYDNDNLVPHSTITGAYTLPATVQAEEGGTEYAVTRVEKEAFLGAGISGHLVIPAYITHIGMSAFENCTGLTEVTYEYSETSLTDENDSNASGAGCSFRGCSGVTTVNLYRTVEWTSINHLDGPFCYQTGVTTVNVGPHVTLIGGYAFHNGSNATGINNINVYSVEPCTLGQNTFDLSDGASINLPNGALEIYQNASASGNRDPWSKYSAYFAELDDAFAITTNKGDDAAYATFYNGDSAVEFFNAEATVYAATSVKIEDETGNVYIESLGSVVPAATAVLVETSEAQTMLAIATTEGATTTPSTNYLYGFDTATDITSPENCVYYMLTYGTDGPLGFYWGATDGGAFKSAAHKAYLAIPNGIANKTSGISIKKDAEGDTTGISSVEASEGAKVSGIYTIQGVRVNNMNQPGLYIVDGKKVMKR